MSFPYYEFVTLTVSMGRIPDVTAGIGGYMDPRQGRGTLLGVWASDIGDLNKIFLLRGFGDLDALRAERESLLLSPDPFGVAAHLNRLTLESYAPFPGIPAPRPGGSGNVYEIRLYELKTGGLAPTLDAWAERLPDRRALSDLTIALYALDGPPRIVHIWPYGSLAERTRIRGEAVERGIWPPRFAQWLTPDMQSTIALPLAISPLK